MRSEFLVSFEIAFKSLCKAAGDLVGWTQKLPPLLPVDPCPSRPSQDGRLGRGSYSAFAICEGFKFHTRPPKPQTWGFLMASIRIAK